MTDNPNTNELLAAMQLVKNEEAKTLLYDVPIEREKFYGREDVLAEIRNALDPIDGKRTERRVFVLHGMVGVGKTRIALRYVKESSSQNKFDIIFWISGDKMADSFQKISQFPFLDVRNGNAIDAFATWLINTEFRCLLVLDNMDEMLHALPPSGRAGSVLITSRNFAICSGTTATNFEVQPFNSKTSVSALLSFIGEKDYTESERASAAEITQAVGGLPLAIKLISNQFNLKHFQLYEQKSIYQRILNVIWERAISQLSGPPLTLQTLLSFLDPNGVYESVLRNSGGKLEDDFAFLDDEMDFLDATGSLLTRALIDRSETDEMLIAHPLIQDAAIQHLSPKIGTKYFDNVILLLVAGLPDTLNVVTGHQFKAWPKYKKYLPHVNFLIALSKKYSLKATDSKKFAELILRCCWYLYEQEQYREAQRFIKIALDILDETHQLLYANAITLRGLIELDMNKAQMALASFLEALKIRETLLKADHALIASCYNNISLAYTELGDKEAVEAGQKAIDIRLQTDIDRIGNSYSNMASTLLRMGKPDEAEKKLKECPALRDFRDKTFLNTGNPRFSGDIVLLARIRQQQGRLKEALHLASKALSFRQKLLSNRLKTCDSLYQVAILLKADGKSDSAIKSLEEIVLIAENLVEAEGYLARANFKLSQLYGEKGNQKLQNDYMAAAEVIRKKLSGDALLTDDALEEAYNRLVPWMLW